MEIDLNDNPASETEEDILKLFENDSSEESSEEISEESEEKKEEESQEEKEEEPKLETEDETLDWNVPTLEALSKKYPEIAKEFPGLKKVLEREAEFTEVFDSAEDAKEAVQRLEDFQQFEKSLLSGNIETVLASVKESDGKAFEGIVNTLLPTLQKVDQNAYLGLLGNVIKATSNSMFQSGSRQKDEKVKNNLQAAAQILNQFAFGTSEIMAPTVSQATKEDPKAKELEDREKQFQDRQFENAKDNLTSRVEKVLEKSVDKYLDPKQQMSDYVRGKAKTEIIEKLDEMIQSDTRFKKNFDALWKDAFENDFSSTTMEKLRKAYLAKAETVLPQILKEVRASALKGTARKVKKSEEDEEQFTPRKRINSTQDKGKNEKPKGTSKDISSFIMAD